MSRWFVSMLCLLVLALACASPVHAASDGHKPSAFDGSLDLTIWTWVVFLLLFLILKKFAWGPMLEGLKAREANIHQAMDEARKAREEAEHARARYAKEMEQANDKIRTMLEEAHRDAEATKAAIIAEAEEVIQTERERSLREIQTAREQTLQDLWNQSAQLASLISAKAIRRELKAEDHRRFVDEALSEMRQAAQAS